MFIPTKIRMWQINAIKWAEFKKKKPPNTGPHFVIYPNQITNRSNEKVKKKRSKSMQNRQLECELTMKRRGKIATHYLIAQSVSFSSVYD